MRYWFDYLPKKVNVNTLNRFEFTDEVLIQNNKNYEERFIFDKFKDYELSLNTYNYFNIIDISNIIVLLVFQL